MDYLKDTSVLVLGLGESGLAMARWCARFGAQVRVWDSRDTAPNAAALAEHVPSAVLLQGPLTDEHFAGVKLVLKSPGLSPLDAAIAAPLKRVADTGILVQGELDLFSAVSDAAGERPERDHSALMATMDELNRRFGRSSVHIGSASTTAHDTAERSWATRQERRSPRFTTRWDEMPMVRA